ncbi:MAG: dockerin type I domain-containing protein [Chthoniobacterales bacterium]
MMNLFGILKVGSLTYLVLFGSLAIASSQAFTKKPLPKEALEKYDNPPALLWRTGVSPRIISQRDAFTSIQVNVNASGQNITGDAANEPSISVDPTNGNKMTIGWRQFDSVDSNFRQAGWGYTSNGGASWTFPGVLESNVFRSDPVLASDTTGDFFYLSLLQTFFDNMWRSLDGGISWANIAPAKGGDKQWFTIDNTNSTGHGFQYQCWSTSGNNYGDRQFTRSTDGGFTWLNPISIPNSPAWGTLDVDSNGLLFIGGVNLNTNQVWCERSSSARTSMTTPSFDQSTAVSLGGSISVSQSINPEGLVGQVFIAVDRSGTATNNNVYMMASVTPTGSNTGSDVMFVRSSDAGHTFSAPVRVNDDPINHSKWHWFGTLAVAPNGRIDSVWLDTRNAANNTDSQLFYSYSTDGGVTWSPNVAVSNSFNPFLGYPNQSKMGDYITIVSDNTGGNVAYTATFNLEEDIYYVRVAPPLPAVTLLSATSRLTHGMAGTFDIAMPLTGAPGVEDRSAGTYNAVLTFDGQVTSGAAAVTVGTATAGIPTFSGNTMSVPLTGVANAQTMALQLSNINADSNPNDGSVAFSFLIGDTTADGSVNSGDISQTKSQSGNPVTVTNFREDVSIDGNINSSDISLVKSKSGSALP